MKRTITVTQKHIEAADRAGLDLLPGDGERTCPLAFALRAVLRPDLEAVVYPRHLSVEDRQQREVLYRRHAPVVAAAIDRYDCEGEMAPFAFTVDIPAALLRKETE